jgi:hypothetical protein
LDEPLEPVLPEAPLEVAAALPLLEAVAPVEAWPDEEVPLLLAAEAVLEVVPELP